jgi:hypothetical protein
MDLQEAQSGRGTWPIAKIAAIVCFVTACAFMIGSLANPAKARHTAPPIAVSVN